MPGERLPNLVGAHGDIMAWLEFFNSKPARDKWLKAAAEVVERNAKLLSSIGKADEIDKLHAEAADLRETVLSSIEKRENDLHDARKRFKEDADKRWADFEERQRVENDKIKDLRREVKDAEIRAKNHEDEARTMRDEAAKALKAAERDQAKAKEIREELAAKLNRAKAIEEAAA